MTAVAEAGAQMLHLTWPDAFALVSIMAITCATVYFLVRRF